MAYENTVLSLNHDGETLLGYEIALRQSDFEVISVSAPVGARFEIEMGRRGSFLTSYLTSFAIYLDLARIFRRSYPVTPMVELFSSWSVPRTTFQTWTYLRRIGPNTIYC